MYIELNFPEISRGDYVIQSFEQKGQIYQRLMKGNFLIMDNTPELVETYLNFLTIAEGNILINGLGMGLCCKYLLDKPNVTKITIVELDKEIIDIIKPNFKDDRLVFIHDNALEFVPPPNVVYDYVWHDIWFYYTSNNLEIMDLLFNKYDKIAKWQGAWNQDKCLELKEKESKRTINLK